MMHPIEFATTPASRRCSGAATRAGLLLLLGAGAIVAAMLLRYHPSIMRQAATELLGTSGRAVLEHALAALGLPLVLNMILVLPTLFRLRGASAFNARLRLSAKPHFAAFWSIASSLSVNSQYRRIHAWVTKASEWLMHNASAIHSAVYFLGTALFEVQQAYFSVYGGDARGYLQYGQMMADAAGALLAMYAAQRFVRDSEPDGTV